MIIDRILAFFGLTTKQNAHNQYCQGISDEASRQIKNREDFRLMDLMSMLNRPVICIGNDWENPLVGMMVDVEFITQARKPVPVVCDALTGKNTLTLSKMMPFTMQRFEALMKLTPYERWCLIDNQNEFHYRCDENRKLPKLLTSEEFLMALHNKGFMEQFKLEPAKELQ